MKEMATTKSLQTLIRQKHDRLGSVPGTLYARIPRAEQQVYGEILTFMGSLERSPGGDLLTSAANRRAISGIIPRLRQTFDQSDYIDAVVAFASEYQGQMDINSEYFRRVFPDFEKPSAWAMDIVQQNRNYVVNTLVNTSADAQYIGPLARTVEEVVLSGAAFDDAIDQIREIAITSPERGSKLMAYSKQIAHDSFAVTDRTYTQQLGKDMGVEWYRYSGGTISETRKFCQFRSNNYYPAKEVETWPRIKWGGKYEGTTSSTIYNYAGGYNCRHSILPVSVFSVPKSRIQEAMRQGYYQPDEKVRQHFNLGGEKAAPPPAPPTTLDDTGVIKEGPGFIGPRRASVAQAEKLHKESKTFGPLLDEIGQTVAKNNGGTVTPINYKKIDRIVEKADKEYGGKIEGVKDAVRNTIVVDSRDQFDKVLREIEEYGVVQKWKDFDPDDAMGYEGGLISVRSKDGVWGEIQVNTPEMIYAKEAAKDSRFILGEEKFLALQKKFKADAGRGHKYYEDARSMKKDLPDYAALQQALDEESKAYYNIFKKPGHEKAIPYRSQFDISDISGSLEKLPDDLDRYFAKPPEAEKIQVSQLIPTRARKDGIVNANKLMKKSYNGGPKREPLVLRKIGPNKYIVLEGNSTYTNAVVSGWRSVYAIIKE